MPAGVDSDAAAGYLTLLKRPDEGLSEADEAAALAPLAMVTPDQATATAQAEVPGDLGKVGLENETGSLVYSVEIGGKDVKVDASDCSIVSADSDD